MSEMPLPDFNYITDRFLIGGYVKSHGQAKGLVGLGVTHVVNVDEETMPDELEYPAWRRVSYLYAPTPDDHKGKPLEWFAKIVPFVLHAVSKPRTKIYGHCAAGISRSALLWYSVFRALGMKKEEIEPFMISKRSVAFWPEYRKSAEDALKQLGYT
jgi:protein-tyrosine phosphatase